VIADRQKVCVVGLVDVVVVFEVPSYGQCGGVHDVRVGAEKRRRSQAGEAGEKAPFGKKLEESQVRVSVRTEVLALASVAQTSVDDDVEPSNLMAEGALVEVVERLTEQELVALRQSPSPPSMMDLEAYV